VPGNHEVVGEEHVVLASLEPHANLERVQDEREATAAAATMPPSPPPPPISPPPPGPPVPNLIQDDDDHASTHQGFILVLTMTALNFLL
jgi:hypothetical protein